MVGDGIPPRLGDGRWIAVGVEIVDVATCDKDGFAGCPASAM